MDRTGAAGPSLGGCTWPSETIPRFGTYHLTDCDPKGAFASGELQQMRVTVRSAIFGISEDGSSFLLVRKFVGEAVER